jgi:hypothetical protein
LKLFLFCYRKVFFFIIQHSTYGNLGNNSHLEMSALWHPTNCEKLQKIKIPKIDLLNFFFIFNHFCKHPISYFTQLCFIKRSLASYCKGKNLENLFFSWSKSKRQKVMIDLLLPSKLSWNGLSAWNTCDWFSEAQEWVRKSNKKTSKSIVQNV